MSTIYGEQHRALQSMFEAQPLADRLRELIITAEIQDDHKTFIESRDFFFLSTVDHRGFPTCSHKGGYPGFVKVLDSRSLAFPLFDGNGMFLSAGNVAGQGKVGMLFIDFETPHRVRAHGTATLTHDKGALSAFPGAALVIAVRVEEIFVNCPRYIHTYQRIATSRYVPCATGQAPAPQWKRIDSVQDVLPPQDRDIAKSMGGVITPDEYLEKLRRSEA
jgi:uncharacterized protein